VYCLYFYVFSGRNVAKHVRTLLAGSEEAAKVSRLNLLEAFHCFSLLMATKARRIPET